MSLNGPVLAFAVEASGAIWLGGDFTIAHGLPRVHVARVLPDGTVDPSFDPGSGPSYAITALAIQGGSRAIAGGAFTEYAGQTAWYLARLNPNGTLDGSFTSGSAPVWGGVLAVRTDGLGRVILGGEFYTVGGQSRVGIARLEPDGRLDSTFNPGTGVANADAFSPLVRTVTLQQDGRVLIGGRFTSVNGVKLNYIARLTGDAAVPVRITSIEPMTANGLRLTVSAAENAVCVLEGSSDLKTWTPLQTNQVSGGSSVFETTRSASPGSQSYRVVQQ